MSQKNVEQLLDQLIEEIEEKGLEYLHSIDSKPLVDEVLSLVKDVDIDLIGYHTFADILFYTSYGHDILFSRTQDPFFYFFKLA